MVGVIAGVYSGGGGVALLGNRAVKKATGLLRDPGQPVASTTFRSAGSNAFHRKHITGMFIRVNSVPQPAICDWVSSKCVTATESSGRGYYVESSGGGGGVS